MTTYVIGDVQGCYEQLLALLDKLQYDPGQDRLWFAGDLVNRGPRSLDTLRFAKQHNAVTVLGNHDLHLLAGAADHRFRRSKDSMSDIFEAPDCDQLLDWLRQQPLLHYDEISHRLLIHAGLPPQWDLAQARACAGEVETLLRSDNHTDFYPHMYGNEPAVWSDELEGWERLRFITNCFTRLRYCGESGRLALEEKGPPGSQASGLRPWFAWPERKSRNVEILFGHWSALGAYDGDHVHALDTGCLWGGKLTAMKLADPLQRIEVECPGAKQPGL